MINHNEIKTLKFLFQIRTQAIKRQIRQILFRKRWIKTPIFQSFKSLEVIQYRFISVFF